MKHSSGDPPPDKKGRGASTDEERMNRPIYVCGGGDDTAKDGAQLRRRFGQENNIMVRAPARTSLRQRAVKGDRTPADRTVRGTGG